MRLTYVSCCTPPTKPSWVGSLETHWNWLLINLMWLKEEVCHCGYGHQLLLAAEDERRKRGTTHAYLDTFSFQAPEFYLKHGYQVFGVLEGFPPGHQRYYLTKKL